MKEKFSDKVLTTVQQLGKTMFLAIAILPFAGILYGIGCSFTNASTIAAYGLEGILHEGTVAYTVLLLFLAAHGLSPLSASWLRLWQA